MTHRSHTAQPAVTRPSDRDRLARVVALRQRGVELLLVEQGSGGPGAGGVGVGDDHGDGDVLTGHEPVPGDLNQHRRLVLRGVLGAA